MKKEYSLDYNIERDTSRVQAVYDILDKLEKDPNENDLEQMASYILYGKDENGLNAVQRGEITNGNTRYNSYRRKDDKLISLDGMMDNPMIDQQNFKPTHVRNVYTNKKPTIARPRYNKTTGELVDPGDSEIPGMTDLWEAIDHYEHMLQVYDGEVAPTEEDDIDATSYRLYKIKHALIELRRQQYYLKEAFKPILRLQGIEHPKAQYYDWDSDSFYWIPIEEWRNRVSSAYTHTVSTNLDDYETRKNEETGEIEVKWIVREHNFDWENPSHVCALIENYGALYEQFKEKIDTSARALLFDFERYCDMAELTDVRKFLIKKKAEQLPYEEIIFQLEQKFGITYKENHLCTIYKKEIPKKIAAAAKKHRMLIETPREQLKTCFTCKRQLPRDPMFFARNRGRKDGYASNCKDCEKKRRIERGEQATHDQRTKDAALH